MAVIVTIVLAFAVMSAMVRVGDLVMARRISTSPRPAGPPRT
jgi:hypothetical protein